MLDISYDTHQIFLSYVLDLKEFAGYTDDQLEESCNDLEEILTSLLKFYEIDYTNQHSLTVSELIEKLSKIPDPNERCVYVCIPNMEYVEVLDVKEDEPSPGVVLVMVNEDQFKASK